jgi:tetratricopeptide (TPR) repeat protein
MIVKNEEENLEGCLDSVADLVDEIVIVDTGSTDRTKEIAKRFRARVLDFEWVDSFAAARNVGLQWATGDWIFWLDADDRLDRDNRDKLRELFAGLREKGDRHLLCAAPSGPSRQKGVRPLEERGSDPFLNVAYSMKCLCHPDPSSTVATLVDHVRLFRRHPAIRWEYRVHEQILPAVRRMGTSVVATDIVIEHVGYENIALRKTKEERNLRLLLLDHAEHPHEPFILFNLGWAYEQRGQPVEALPYLQESLQLSQPSDSIVRKLYNLLAACWQQLDRPQDALAAVREGRRYYPDDAQLLFQEGLLCQRSGELDHAEICYQRLITGREGSHFDSVADGLRGYLARHNLADLYRQQDRLAEAEAQWQQALSEQPRFLPARLELGELYLRQNRLQEFDSLLANLHEQTNGAANPETAIGILALKSRAHLARKEYPAAKEILTSGLAQYPGSVYLWEVQSHCLLQEDSDHGAAERALRKVLELQPDNMNARRNLEILLTNAKH